MNWHRVCHHSALLPLSSRGRLPSTRSQFYSSCEIRVCWSETNWVKIEAFMSTLKWEIWFVTTQGKEKVRVSRNKGETRDVTNCWESLWETKAVAGAGKSSAGLFAQFWSWEVEQGQAGLDARQGAPHNLVKLQRFTEVARTLYYRYCCCCWWHMNFWGTKEGGLSGVIAFPNSMYEFPLLSMGKRWNLY